MIAPLKALIIAGIGVLMIAFVFWPKVGLFTRWKRAMRTTRRVLMEDALKHLYNCEYKKLSCTLQSISGTLSIDGDDTAELMARLETLGLVKSQGEGFQLTSDGRSYALRVIRVHRLWERYLADETGVQEVDWHHEAERLEHTTTPDEAEALSAQMGNPSYDPHGDPIPTSDGELPSQRGKPLIDLPEGELAQIIHIEDEPSAVYAQLVAQGLNPGMRIQVVEVSQERIRFVADGEEHVLAPIFAANVTAVLLPKDQKMEGPYESLSILKPGERGEVIGISRSYRGQKRRRLMDLGVIPGTVIEAEMQSASGDPTAYRIRGAVIALRKKQADMIYIHSNKEVA